MRCFPLIGLSACLGLSVQLLIAVFFPLRRSICPSIFALASFCLPSASGYMSFS